MGRVRRLPPPFPANGRKPGPAGGSRTEITHSETAVHQPVRRSVRLRRHRDMRLVCQRYRGHVALQAGSQAQRLQQRGGRRG